MAEHIRDTGEELILCDDQHTLLRVTGPTRLLGAALAGVHVLPSGALIAAGIITRRLVIDSGGACRASGYIRAVPQVARDGFLDMTGHLDPARWPRAEIEGIILIAVGTRYRQHVVTPEGTLSPAEPSAPAPVGEDAMRFRILHSGPALVLAGPADPADIGHV